jgi:hypothetical protein
MCSSLTGLRCPSQTDRLVEGAFHSDREEESVLASMSEAQMHGRSSSPIAYVRPTLDVISAMALIVACGVFIWKSREPVSQDPADLGVRVAAQDASGRIEAELITNRLGSASIVLVEFVDFECRYCAQFARDTLPRIKGELVGQGILEFAVLNYPLEAIHPRAFRASEAAECAASQGRYWQMHDRLLAQPSALSEADLLGAAAALAL